MRQEHAGSSRSAPVEVRRPRAPGGSGSSDLGPRGFFRRASSASDPRRSAAGSGDLPDAPPGDRPFTAGADSFCSAPPAPGSCERLRRRLPGGWAFSSSLLSSPPNWRGPRTAATAGTGEVYPPVFERRGIGPRAEWLDSYLTTFLERDLPMLGFGLPAQRLRTL